MSNCSHNTCKIEFLTFLLRQLDVTYRSYKLPPKIARFSTIRAKTI